MAKILQDNHTPLHNFQISGATRMSHLRKAHQVGLSEVGLPELLIFGTNFISHIFEYTLRIVF